MNGDATIEVDVVVEVDVLVLVTVDVVVEINASSWVLVRVVTFVKVGTDY